MNSVSVREFSYNPSAMFARVEQGETLQVTRHGKVIAVLSPGPGNLDRYTALISKGVMRLGTLTTADLDQVPEFDIPADVSLLDLLLAERAEDDR